METSTKTKTSNQRHLKEEQQKATNGKWKHALKTKTSNKKHFSLIFSFICFNSGPMEGSWHQEQWKTRKSNNKQQKATKSNQKAKTDIRAEKTKTSSKGHKKFKWKPGLNINC